ncbi:MAG: polyprenyl synthetase family protein [Patescibacteria group bacterium]|nr:polyprenyl synthetase family protein [Patescibacteria group bacterium]
MQLQEFIDIHRPIIHRTLKGYLESRIAEPPATRFSSDSLERLQPLILSGKLLRGVMIVMLASFYSEIKPDSGVYKAAAAMECIQTALLVHDDIIDNDETRRGMKSTYASYRDTAEEYGYRQAEAYGKSMAICAGDIAIFLAFDLLSQSATSPEHVARIVGLFARETQIVAAGEMLDIDLAARISEPEVEEIFEMYIYKTARYSFSLPFAAGAVLGGADDRTVEELITLGKNIGVLFQMQDDWLGLYGNESQTGKPVGSDFREHKKTVYRAMLVNTLNKEERARLDSMHIDEFLRLLSERNVEKKISEIRHCYEQESFDIISRLAYSDKQKDMLREIVHYVVHRNH